MHAPSIRSLSVVAAVLLGLIQAGNTAEPPPLPPAAPEAPVAARAILKLPMDGATDVTAALQAALDAAAKPGGGGRVDLGAGKYRLNGAITVPAGVTLAGVWESPHFSRLESGTVLLAYGGRGNEEGEPLISLKSNSAVRGLTVFYPEQSVAEIKPYPWTIRGEGTHGSVMDATLLNPYRGIDFGTRRNECHYIRNVYGCPLRTGVYLDRCTDIGRVENVHFNPNSWTRSGVPGAPRGGENEKLTRYLQENLTAFDIGRSDWEFLLNTFSWGAKVGYRFFKSPDGPTNGNFLGMAADWAVIPLLVEDVQPPGLLITNGEFVGSPGAEACVRIAATNTGPVQLSNTAFWGPHERVVLAEGKGTVSLSQCVFVQWDNAKKGVPAVEVLGGSLILQGSVFRADKPQVRLGPDARSAVILGNQARGEWRVKNESKGDVQVIGNVSVK